MHNNKAICISAKEGSLTALVYKVLTVAEWGTFAKSGQFGGSKHDQRDGFIHMCSGPQLFGTLEKHYAKIDQIVLVGFESRAFGKDLKWEISRGDEKFPHLYSDLPFSALVNVHRLAQTLKGGFVLPLEV